MKSFLPHQFRLRLNTLSTEEKALKTFRLALFYTFPFKYALLLINLHLIQFKNPLNPLIFIAFTGIVF